MHTGYLYPDYMPHKTHQFFKPERVSRRLCLKNQNAIFSSDVLVREAAALGAGVPVRTVTPLIEATEYVGQFRVQWVQASGEFLVREVLRPVSEAEHFV